MNAPSFSLLRSSLLALVVAAPVALTGCIVVTSDGNDDGGTSNGNNDGENACAHEGNTYDVGETFSVDCNTCRCDEDGAVACTEMFCAPVCEYEGQTYPEGASFPAADGCNTCTCTADGSVACTKIGCECNPAAEWWRDYVSEDPAQCEVIDYACPENTEAFGNACGCGCEQSAECQETYNCMPPSDCNVEEIQAQCPYSQIVY
ncbi:hypothetical protein [Chondromyces crocatus]|uniref:VWFC domain-containing protein n=1 Tax=Chondromyces crocatus TaxID=52 RepID=A0A0K1E9D7_CHOCO|nr:hypothetical protein [Chondromyces crocatus]AKT37496.1 uncharacterized protein CMC5_016370 [Chondromyces crocatus]